MGYRKAAAGFALVGSVSSAFAFACSSFDGDAPPPVEAGTVDAAPHFFCDDYRDANVCFSFENGNPDDPRFGGGLEPVASGAAAQLIDDASASPPHSLQIDISNGVGVETPKAGVRVVAADAGTRARCEFAFWVDQGNPPADPSTANVNLGLVGVPSIANSDFRLWDYSIRLLADAGDMVEVRTGSSTEHSTASVIPLRTWQNGAVFLEVVDGKLQEYGRVGTSVSAPKEGVNKSLAIPGQIGPFVMELGETYVTGHWTVRIDNVVCYWN